MAGLPSAPRADIAGKRWARTGDRGRQQAARRRTPVWARLPASRAGPDRTGATACAPVPGARATPHDNGVAVHLDRPAAAAGTAAGPGARPTGTAPAGAVA